MKKGVPRAILRKKEKITPSVYLITLDLDEGFFFKAGQYVNVQIPTEAGYVERSFSIASKPSQSKSIEILVKLIRGGIASSFFEQKEVHSEIYISEPKGNLEFLHQQNQIHFIASGTGMAPFRSIIFDILENTHYCFPLHMILGAPDEDEIILEKELYNLAKNYDNFNYSTIIDSDPSKFPDIYIDKIDYNIKSSFYICGNPNFVEDIKTSLIKRGVDIKFIHHE